MHFTTDVTIFITLLGVTHSLISRPNCTAKNKIACYVCMGDYETDCDFQETVCCSGACFKVVDKEHKTVLKGCTTDEEEDGSMKIRSYDVRIANDETVKGQSYFCNLGDYCNESKQVAASLAIGIICFITCWLSSLHLL